MEDKQLSVGCFITQAEIHETRKTKKKMVWLSEQD